MTATESATTTQFEVTAIAMAAWNDDAIDQYLADARVADRVSLLALLALLASLAIVILFEQWALMVISVAGLVALALISAWRQLGIEETLDWYRRRQSCFAPRRSRP